MNITQLQPLIPFETITPSQNLLDSISRYGVLTPVMVVDGKYYGKVTLEKLPEILDEYRKEAK